MAVVPTRSSTNSNASADINTLQAQIDALGIGGDGFKLTLDGNAYVGTKILGIVIGSAVTIGLVRVAADVAPVGADLQIDINKNGTTIYTTQANRPIITDGNTTDVAGTPDVVSFAAGDILTIDIDQIGSSTPGGDFIYITIPIT